ncbi:LptA/OstA family protein [Prosthecomicrobium sp. N25]|uniref:LptA/OstA family protein n=1 Tax=Prosthecomicrobium sp. N25 TaxID=3129254 RepID=UPI0030773911
MTPSFRPLLLAAALCLAATGHAAAQASMSDAFKGFGSNTRDPIQIEADSLEVRDREAFALFSGNVQVRQKDTVLRTARLRVFYEGKAAEGSPTTSQRIRRFEAEGRVSISQGDQSVAGDSGWFDMRADQALLTGGVVLTQGKNVAKGEKLTIDLKSGQYRLDSGAPGKGRVQIVIEPTQGKP